MELHNISFFKIDSAKSVSDTVDWFPGWLLTGSTSAFNSARDSRGKCATSPSKAIMPRQPYTLPNHSSQTPKQGKLHCLADVLSLQ